MAIPHYTNELLARNFNHVADGFGATGVALDALQSQIIHLEGHVGELSSQVMKLSKATPKKNSKLLVLTVVGVGVYLGYQYAKAEFEDKNRAKDVAEDLKDKATATVRSAADKAKEAADKATSNT